MAEASSLLLNHTIVSITDGVSQQVSENRFESQVEDMVNCVPSVSRGVLRRNPLLNPYIISTVTGNLQDAYVYSYDRGTGDEQYMVVVGDDSKWYVFNTNDGTLEGSGTDSYLTIPAGSKPKECFQCVTIGDYTFIINNTVTVEMSSSTAGSANREKEKAFYWIKKNASVAVSSSTSQTTSGDNTTGSQTTRLEGYTFELNGQEVQGGKGSGLYGPDTQSIASQLGSQLSYPTTEAYVYSTTTPGSWSWRDSFGNEASLGVHNTVDDASKLPAFLPDAIGDFYVTVTGGEGVTDDYYYFYDNSDNRWRETMKGGILTTINSSTMPQVFVRQANGSFTFEPYTWDDRKVGDDDSAPVPSFINKKLSSIFFHKNRLGFITGDSIVLSETGEYGNFFFTTVQSIPADDPIDLTVATTDVTILRHAVSTTGTLLLFSDDAQFTLTSSNGPLTPETAVIDTVSNYTYSNTAPAKALNNKVYFISNSGGYSQLYAYRLTDGLQSTEAIPLTAHIPSYLPSTLNTIIGHSVLGYVFMFSKDEPTTIYVLNTLTLGTQDVQNAFHKWEFSTDIVDIFIVKNSLFVYQTDGYIRSMTLELPGDITSLTYADNTDISYTSKVVMSRFHVRNQDGKGDVRGRTQLRTMMYSFNSDDSVYMTTIYNKKLTGQIDPQSPWLLKSGYWDDTLTWDDTSTWVDILPLYERIYRNDDRVSIISNSKDTVIEFSNNDEDPDKGFALATVNVEAFYHQRSIKY
jgi:hypothetical protein